MKLLLDTHALVWSVPQVKKLSQPAKLALEDAETVFVSVASAWEIAIKVGHGKWPAAQPLIDEFELRIASFALELLPITVAHVRKAGSIQDLHRDPFDRLLVAQALAEGLTLVSSDIKVQSMGDPGLS